MKNKLYLHPITKDRFISKDQYFKIMFGEEFMADPFKGTIREYEENKL
jgi:hypothetical protein